MNLKPDSLLQIELNAKTHIDHITAGILLANCVADKLSAIENDQNTV